MNPKFVNFLIVFGSHLAHIVSIGMSVSFGILYSEIHGEFKAAHSETAWIVSIFNGLIGLVGIPLGVLVHKINERWLTVVGTILLSCGMITSSFATQISTLYITYGLISGVGAGIIHFCANTIVFHHFDAKWCPLAITLANSGSAVCSLVLPPIITTCIERYSWQTTFIVLGGISTLGFFSAASYVSPHEKPDGHKDSPESKYLLYLLNTDLKTAASAKQCVISILRNKQYMIFFVSSVTAFTVVFGPATFLPDLMHDAQKTQQEVSTSIMTMGFGNLVGRLISGVLASRFNQRVQWIHAFTLLGFALTTAALALAQSVTAFVVLSTLLGMCFGGYFGLHMAVVAHYLSIRQLSVGFGLITTVNGIALTAGVPLAGLVSDKFSGEQGSFVFGGCVLFIATLIVTINLVNEIFTRKSTNVQSKENDDFDACFDNEIVSTYL